jgi:hypothetical protein
VNYATGNYKGKPRIPLSPPHSFKCCVNKKCQKFLDSQSQTPVDSNDVLIETSACAPVLLFETLNILEGLRGRARMMLDLQLPMQSVPIITNVVSSNHTHGEMYSIQHYVIKFVSDLRQVGGFLQVLRFPPPIKLTATI